MVSQDQKDRKRDQQLDQRETFCTMIHRCPSVSVGYTCCLHAQHSNACCAVAFFAHGLREPQHATEEMSCVNKAFSLIELLMGLAILRNCSATGQSGVRSADRIERIERKRRSHWSVVCAVQGARRSSRNQAVVDSRHKRRLEPRLADYPGYQRQGSTRTADNPLLARAPQRHWRGDCGQPVCQDCNTIQSSGRAGVRRFPAGTLHVCAAREPQSEHQVVLASNGRISLRSDKAEQALCADRKDSEQRTDPQFFWHGERDVLLAPGQFIGTGSTPGLQLLNHAAHQDFRSGSASGDTDPLDTVEPALVAGLRHRRSGRPGWPCVSASSRRRLELELFGLPTTSTTSHSSASCLTASWRFCVA